MTSSRGPGDDRTRVDRDHFDGIAAKYAQKDLVPGSALARRSRLEKTLADVPLRKTWDILEVGCGAGFAASYLRGRFASYRGMDHSAELIQAAEKYNSGPGVDFSRMDLRDIAEERTVDLVFMIGVLHHLDDPLDALVRLRRILRPGGYIAVNEPQPANPIFSTARGLRALIDRTYSDDQDEIPYSELLNMFESAGFADVAVKPQGLVSTPFAEVPMAPEWLFTRLAKIACRIDTAVEEIAGKPLRYASWNFVAVGRCPDEAGCGEEAAERGNGHAGQSGEW